jgi:hypothetical protein
MAADAGFHLGDVENICEQIEPARSKRGKGRNIL